MTMWKNSFFAFVCLVSSCTLSATETSLRFPVSSAHSHYFLTLLNTSLENNGSDLRAQPVEMPASRAKKSLEQGRIDIINLLQSAERDHKFLPIKIGLTDGLIGKRVLLVPKDKSVLYQNIKTLEDFRDLKLTAGMGAKWFDVKVWEHNNLDVYKHSGDYRLLYNMLAKGRSDLDYFSTGFNEVAVDDAKYSDLGLEVEPNLLLVYQRDFIFYMRKNIDPAIYTEVSDALIRAKNQGEILEAVQQNWQRDFEKYHFSKRIQLQLETPQ